MGFTLGYSPDGLVGDDGLIEAKSRVQKYQFQAIIEHVASGSASVPAEFVMQLQTGLLGSECQWIDFISYSNGLLRHPTCGDADHPQQLCHVARARVWRCAHAGDPRLDSGG